MTEDKDIQVGLATNGKTLGELFGDKDKELKTCKVKQLLNGEVVTGTLNPDGSFTDVQVVPTPEYEIPSDDKVGTKILDEVAARTIGTEVKTIWVEDIEEEEFVSKALVVYKRMWDSDWIYFKVGTVDSRGSVVLDLPREQESSSYYDPLNKDKYKEELKRKGYPLTVQKFSPIWYRDNDISDKRIIVSFIPSNDIYEIINSNKNESIGYVSHEGNVIYWNQYRS